MRFYLGALFFALPAFAAGPKYKLPLDGEKSKVEFLAVGNPSAIKIRGELKGKAKEALKGELKLEDFKAKGKIIVKLDAFETGIGLRDRHLREKYLETGKYPEAVLEITDLRFPQSFAEDGFSAEAEPFKGTLTLREKTMPVAGTVSMNGNKENVEMKFAFPLKTTDYKIDTPSFMGVTVASDVAVTAEVKIKPEKLP